MKYLDLLWMLDVLYRCYPKYHSNELLVMADDICKWCNNELPEDSSTLIYLKSYFSSPYAALTAVINEVTLLGEPLLKLRLN